ncbi:zinc finger protein 395-like [Palaemon carinicauda]|uniref:zinc finger protein 395-like n=1 Tax=Palaemon carinicauda TaxID=392227 RepID=UPI0035B58107
MSTGKRLAKRSILGTRVACCLDDGKYHGGVICAVKNTDEGGPPVYSVRVEGERRTREVREGDLVGSGFTAVGSVKLRSGQKVYITHNNREVSGNVLYHRPNIDEVLISVISPETGVKQDVKKRIEDIRLLESRKSARLADQDTDFAKLADMSTDRKDRKPSQTIDVPAPSGFQGNFEEKKIVVTLGAPFDIVNYKQLKELRSEVSFTSGLRYVNQYVLIIHARRSSTRTMFKCTWTGCQEMTSACDAIERHIRSTHLGRQEVNSDHSDSDSDDEDDHEEEFYWTEVEVNVATWVDPCEPLVTHSVPASTPPAPAMALTLTTMPAILPSQPPIIADVPNIPVQPSHPKYVHVSSPPTLSHMDMARPPHEDPLYKRHLSGPVASLSSSWPRSSAYLSSGRGKVRVSSSPKASPGRGKRNGESRKCRKVYGMEQRDLWCTQCKWKKACSRFGE